MHQEFQLDEFETNGIRVRAAVEGTGPLVVMIHGFPELWYSWRHQIKPVAAAGFRVVAPDVRGYGGSDKPHEVEAYDMETLMNDVVGLIDALGEEKAVLVGHDWGGAYLLEYRSAPSRKGLGRCRSECTLPRPHRRPRH